MYNISVVIPVEKQTKEFNKVIQSVLNQNYQDFQIIVVSSCKIDNPVINPKIQYISLYHAKSTPELLNKSIHYINSNLVCFLNPNDLLLYNALKLRYEKFIQNHSLVACYGFGIDTDLNYQVKCNQNYEYFYKNEQLPHNSLKSILSGNIRPSISSLMIKTDVLKRLNFNQNLKFNFTWDFFIKLFRNFDDNICQMQEAIYISRNEELLINEYDKSYFTKQVKETLLVLDNFFEKTFEDNSARYKVYRDNYSHFFSILTEYYPYNYWLRVYLLTSYIRKNKELGNKILDLWFLSVLLNSIIAANKPDILNNLNMVKKASY
ncbi:MAG: hypothetical protein A2287_10675 [Candidatus Melainabacteria bacterium RIFOXYA12_FULL_32_12]|nr:MAG: hypothetical protein A2255_01675 [Candidatus Melainabacteria bacterium RIFOXYA2_FULL_32_9]OGI24268.1 MAG: hypothetical protein A2287_10675 [Candidatus Melainabacteria bacterium RIFOXYA12_FULL_32_12]